MKLAGRRALVTGAAQGIGAAIARRLVTDGAQVVAADRDEAALADLARSTEVATLTLDVSDPAEVSRSIGEVGPFSVLVNNVGGDQHAFFTETGPDDWTRLIAINLVSVLACTRAVIPAMQAAKFGRIINIASEAGRLGSRGGSVYAAAKGGVIAFTRSIARENGRYAITANVVAPGPIKTRMLDEAVEVGGPNILAAMTGATLLKRLGTPDDIAAAVAFLASDEASFITGETLGVSGGMGIGGS